MVILSIDPGTHTSGVAIYDSRTRHLLKSWEAAKHHEVFGHIESARDGAWVVVVERPEGMGRLSIQQASDTIATAWIAGRFCQAAKSAGLVTHDLTRREVRRLLGVLSAKGNTDAVIGRAVYADHGGIKRDAVGTRRAPGPLYGITKTGGHAMQALAVGLAWLESIERGAP